MTLSMHARTMQQWFETSLGQYLLEEEQSYFDQAVINIFGYNALQIGFSQLNFLRANRIPYQFRLGISPGTSIYALPDFLPVESGSMDLVLLPHSLSLKMSWKMLEAANKGLFSQMITVPLFSRHRILSQVAGHGMNIVKFIPPLILTESDIKWIIDATKSVIHDAHRGPAAVWDLGKTLATKALRRKVST